MSNATTFVTALVVAAASLAPAASAQTAGQVLFVQGDVQIRAVDGALRPARQGMPVSEGERIVTGDGAMAQMKLSDGGYVGLRSGSGLRVEPGVSGGGAGRSMELTGGSVRVLNAHLGADATPYRLQTPHGEVNVRGGDALAGVVPVAPGGGAGGATRTVVRLNRGTGTAAARSGTPLQPGTGDTVAVNPAGAAPQRIAGGGLPQLDGLPPRRGSVSSGARTRGRALPDSLAAVRPAQPSAAVLAPRLRSPLAGFDYAAGARVLTPVTGAEPARVGTERVLEPNVLTAVTTGRLPGVRFTDANRLSVNDSLDTGVRTILSAATGGDLTKAATSSTTDTTLRGAILPTTTLTTTTSTLDPRVSATTLKGTLSDTNVARPQSGGTPSTAGALNRGTVLRGGTFTLSR